jgi:Fe2+ or Zn2+ uptake regulation protein
MGRTVKMGELVGKPVAPKKQTFVQMERSALAAMGELIRRSPTAARVLSLLCSMMDKANAVAISHQLLADRTGCSLATIKRSLQILLDDNWVEVWRIGKSGTVNAYVVNSRVAWADKRDNREHAIFAAQIVVDRADTPENQQRQTPLRKIPIIFPPEMALVTGAWPNGAQTQLPGMETVTTGLASDSEEDKQLLSLAGQKSK